jgi:hypothetical protein
VSHNSEAQTRALKFRLHQTRTAELTVVLKISSIYVTS